MYLTYKTLFCLPPPPKLIAYFFCFFDVCVWFHEKDSEQKLYCKIYTKLVKSNCSININYTN